MSIEESLANAGVKLFQHKINDSEKALEGDDRPEFAMMAKYCRGLGLDIGCGTNRLSNSILTTDWYPHSDTDLIWNCAPDPENGVRYFIPYPFRENRFDFIFASHVLEDFHPDIIQHVFDEWLRMIKIGGYLVVIIPDMEGGRYPDWDEVFTEEDEEVKQGKRQVNELKGNPSHRITAGKTMCYNLMNNSKYKMEVVQIDEIPHTTMSLDFVVRKIS
jgi:predicted SAM-dependent methyltransferase